MDTATEQGHCTRRESHLLALTKQIVARVSSVVRRLRAAWMCAILSKMDKAVVEVKSTIWQKIFISLLFLPYACIGVVGWLAPFVPAFRAGASTLIEPIGLGSISFFAGFAIWWPVIKYSICADEQGITQTNGFFRQSVRWADVASYSMEINRRYHKERRFHVEPVTRNQKGEIVFHGFAHLLVSSGKIIQQRRELWQFVEQQLEGKRTAS